MVAVGCTTLKGSRCEWLVEKSTELGAHGLIPFTTERSQVRAAVGGFHAIKLNLQRVILLMRSVITQQLTICACTLSVTEAVTPAASSLDELTPGRCQVCWEVQTSSVSASAYLHERWMLTHLHRRISL